MGKRQPLTPPLPAMEKSPAFRQSTLIVLGSALGAALVLVAILCLLFPKYFSFVYKNVRRNMLRTTLASLAIMVLVLVVTSVWSILVPLDAMLSERTSDIKAI